MERRNTHGNTNKSTRQLVSVQLLQRHTDTTEAQKSRPVKPKKEDSVSLDRSSQLAGSCQSSRSLPSDEAAGPGTGEGERACIWQEVMGRNEGGCVSALQVALGDGKTRERPYGERRVWENVGHGGVAIGSNGGRYWKGGLQASDFKN